MDNTNFLIFVPEKARYIHIYAGGGSALTDDDIESGYVDYAVWDLLRPGLDEYGELNYEIEDGGQLLLIDDITSFETNVIVSRVMEFAGFEGCDWEMCEEVSKWNTAVYID